MFVDVINIGDIDREVFGVFWGINGFIFGIIVDYFYIIGCER